MKKVICILLLSIVLTSSLSHAQSFDEDRIVLANFTQRLYSDSPFEGCRIIDDYDSSYLLSVVLINPAKYKTPLAANRVSQVKSQRNAGEFLNGTQTWSEFTIKTPKADGKTEFNNIDETIEVIKANTIGYVQQMQLLTSFTDSENMKVFIYYKELKL